MAPLTAGTVSRSHNLPHRNRLLTRDGRELTCRQAPHDLGDQFHVRRGRACEVQRLGFAGVAISDDLEMLRKNRW